MPVEHPLGGALSATMSTHVEDPVGHQPETIIQVEDPWEIHVDWTIDGAAAGFLGGDWQVRAFVEQIGGPFEGQVGTDQNVPLDSVAPPAPRNYSCVINVPANTVPEGTHRLITLLNYSNGGVPEEMAGFVEGPMLQFYSH